MRRRMLLPALAVAVALLLQPGDALAKPPPMHGCFTGRIGALQQWGCWAHGDVDGDGAADDVTVARRPLRDGRSRFLVLAFTGRGRVQLALPDVTAGPGPCLRSLRGQLTVQGLARLDSRRGLETLVQLWCGAANCETDVLAFRGGRLRLVRGPFPDTGAGSSWETGGTVGTGETLIDCVGSGSARKLVTELGWPSKGRWQLRRALWRLDGDHVVRLASWSGSSPLGGSGDVRGPISRPRSYDFRHCGLVLPDSPAR